MGTPPKTLTVSIQRYDPERDTAPRSVAYEVPRQEGMVVADVLQYLYEHQAPDLGFLWECRTRRCGTCAVRVGDRPVLTCSEPVCDGMQLSLTSSRTRTISLEKLPSFGSVPPGRACASAPPCLCPAASPVR